MLSIQDVGFRYGNRQVLKNINIQLQKGETVAIIGPSGVGKTTLLTSLQELSMPNKVRLSWMDPKKLKVR